ncbi:hypothetical protein [Mycolicibacterium komossense]|uniref:Uncharacterized protein n=1 Tax=Mycolicibacterium komossense TaxID=1779 RepID=A0ABT3C9C2_9MYCO|nr:hypothetical protein [Mycolicibacterium komossense]MCV7226075.1 hypothetical protein [Mycolicibacterium komossense]
MALRDYTKTDTPDPATDTGEATTSTTEADASTQPAATDPQRVVIEQAPAEPAVFYGEGGIVPSAVATTDPDQPFTPAEYKPFEW